MPAVSRRAAAPPSEAAVHQSHSDVVNRLKRADGHLQTIVAMLESGRDCAEVAQQMRAVINALEKANKVLIHDHIDHCLEKVAGPPNRRQRATIEQFKEITKYL